MSDAEDNLPITMTDVLARRVLLPYIQAFRRLIETSACLVLEYCCYILIVKMMSSVFWNFLTRLGYFLFWNFLTRLGYFVFIP